MNRRTRVSIGNLGCVLANIIMTELEKVVVDYLVDNGTMKFYARYVDVMLLMMKQEDVKIILKRLNCKPKKCRLPIQYWNNNILRKIR